MIERSPFYRNRSKTRSRSLILKVIDELQSVCAKFLQEIIVSYSEPVRERAKAIYEVEAEAIQRTYTQVVVESEMYI